MFRAFSELKSHVYIGSSMIWPVLAMGIIWGFVTPQAVAESAMLFGHEPSRISRRLVCLSQAASAEAFCWPEYAASNFAGD
jgi:hypothetical protein